MPFLSDRERQILTLICDTLIPELDIPSNGNSALYQTKASDYGVAEMLEETLETTRSQFDLQQFRLLMRTFNSGIINRLTGGIQKSFEDMTFEEREALLFNWGDSRLETKRKAFQSIKRTALFLHYAHMPDDKLNPVWESFNYEGPPGGQEVQRTIHPTRVDSDTVLTTDVLVIGSGAGGGVVAGELTEAGFDVVIVEKGAYHNEQDFDGREIESTAKLFERRGALATNDTAMLVLAGSTLGGGTTVNWSASFRTPDHVLQEWSRDYGFDGADSVAMQQSFDAVSHRLNVNIDESIPNPNNSMLARGCEQLNYHLGVIPRNVKGCEDCGFCGYGCPFGAKQGTLKTYLQDAHDRGARILVHANVKSINVESGRAVGANITVQYPEGESYEVTVRAKAVVVSAGTVNTPAILRRSGLHNPNIGANLHLHPVTVVFSEFDEEVLPWRGVPMSRYSRQFADLDGRGYGVYLETAPAHPGLSAASLPWTSALNHKQLVSRIHHMANVIVLTRDFHGGHVTVDRKGNSRLDYRVHPYDLAHLQKGLVEALRVHHAAGAKTVYTGHNAQYSYTRGQNGSFDSFIQRVENAGLHPNAYALFSAHQMSSCRIGGSAEIGAIDPTGESYEVKNLFVADGSVLPTATGVNPMISIMGTAHYIAQQIKSKLS